MHAYPQNGLEVVDMTIVLELSWIDERFKNWPTKAPVPSDTWKPKVFSSRTPSLVEGWASASVQILEPDTGMMVMSFSGTAIGHPIAFDSNRMSSFPFDRLHVSVSSVVVLWVKHTHTTNHNENLRVDCDFYQAAFHRNSPSRVCF